MKIAIDFDGTCVTHDFPRIGKDIGAVPVLKELVEKGHKLILFTMRSNKVHGTYGTTIDGITGNTDNCLTDAVNWFKENGISLYGIQSDPGQKKWTSSPKCYAELYIDDAALGTPLITNHNISSKPYVNWNEVRNILIRKGVL